MMTINANYARNRADQNLARQTQIQRILDEIAILIEERAYFANYNAVYTYDDNDSKVKEDVRKELRENGFEVGELLENKDLIKW